MSRQLYSVKVDVGSEFFSMSLEQELEIKYQLEGPRQPQSIFERNTCKLL
jgi:hypothetical protein